LVKQPGRARDLDGCQGPSDLCAGSGAMPLMGLMASGWRSGGSKDAVGAGLAIAPAAGDKR